MSDSIRKQKLHILANDFYRATGIQLSILDGERSCIVSAGVTEHHFCNMIQSLRGGESCIDSDKRILDKCTISKKPEMHVCHAGLVDIAAPILCGEEICGYIILGRMRRDISLYSLGNYYPVNIRESLLLAYKSIPIYSEERVMSLMSLVSMLASYIILNDLMTGETDELSECITKYIRENLHKSISVDEICRHVGISKNTLHRNMRRCKGVSLGEYILSERLSLAKRLLLNTEEPISSVCEQVGYSDASYFCKIFKRNVGISPLQYRKNNGNS